MHTETRSRVAPRHESSEGCVLPSLRAAPRDGGVQVGKISVFPSLRDAPRDGVCRPEECGMLAFFGLAGQDRSRWHARP